MVSNEQGVANLCEVASHLLKTMPVNAATKFAVRTVLREATNKSRPNYRGNDNKKNATYATPEAIKAYPGGGVVADHAIPLSLLLKRVYSQGICEATELVKLCKSYSTLVLLTPEQDRHLTDLGLKNSMPSDWNGADLFSRYKAASIKVVPFNASDAPDD